MRADLRRPFDLAEGPLLRATLYTLGDGAQALLLTVHHLVLDGVSIPLLLEEVDRGYRALRAGSPLPTDRPEHTFADFAAWQRDLLDGPAGDRLRAYWTDRLRGPPDLRGAAAGPPPAAGARIPGRRRGGARPGGGHRAGPRPGRRGAHLAVQRHAGGLLRAAAPLQRPGRCRSRHPDREPAAQRLRRRARVLHEHGRAGRAGRRAGVLPRAAAAHPPHRARRAGAQRLSAAHPHRGAAARGAGRVRGPAVRRRLLLPQLDPRPAR
ncbi:hypothetical protein IHE61_04210 [Streptomyces sp. GKU 257-1]|nr:hypothetical protein [Streptomyces sp. GKU 257-1]